ATAAVAVREIRYTVDESLGATALPTFLYSNDASAYTAPGASEIVRGRSALEPGFATLRTYRDYLTESVGAHRAWRFERSSGSSATAFTDVWLLGYGAE